MTGIRPLAKESMDGVLSDARAAATDLVGISDKITLWSRLDYAQSD